ncbi:MAG: dephospho-CoA kinase [Prevotellaceae bacterium]|jgi:dephospho-CoA kinase|nr:dephospho-CoA kinase [Prevotellaceae bacterium]
MKKVAITGGIGSGKSVVSGFLQTIGYPVYNSDEQSKRLLNENQDLREKLCETFGKDLYRNAKLDKKLFASLIFGNEKLLKKANAIIHPAVYEDFERWAKAQTADIVFAETALYFQGNAKKYIPFSILVQAPLELRIQRAMQRDNSSEKEILARIKNQMPDENVSHLADFHILNDEKHLIIPQVLQIIEELKQKTD